MIISKELCVLVCVGYAFIFKNMQKRMNLKPHTQKQAYRISSSKYILWATLQMQGEFQWYLKQCLASPSQSWKTVCASGGVLWRLSCFKLYAIVDTSLSIMFFWSPWTLNYIRGTFKPSTIFHLEFLDPASQKTNLPSD